MGSAAKVQEWVLLPNFRARAGRHLNANGGDTGRAQSIPCPLRRRRTVRSRTVRRLEKYDDTDVILEQDAVDGAGAQCPRAQRAGGRRVLHARLSGCSTGHRRLAGAEQPEERPKKAPTKP